MRAVKILSVVWLFWVVFAGCSIATPLVNVAFDGKLYSPEFEDAEMGFSGFFTTTYNPQRKIPATGFEFDISYYEIEVADILLIGDSGKVVIWPQDILIHINGLVTDAEINNTTMIYVPSSDGVLKNLDDINIYDAILSAFFESYGSPTLWYTDDSGVDLYASRIQIIGAVPAPIPEPATMLLLGSGVVGIAASKRKKA